MFDVLSVDRASRRRRRAWGAAIGLCTLLAASALTAATGGPAAAGASQQPWLDTGQPVSVRVGALLHAMTLSEKVGQMDQQLVTTLTDSDGSRCGDNGFNLPNPTCMKKVLIDQHAGSILAGGTDNPIDTTGAGGPGDTGYDWANEYNMIQQYAIKHSRLHLPVIFGVDAVHGFGHPYQAPLYPQSIGMGATWDPAAARSGGAATARAPRNRMVLGLRPRAGHRP